MNIMISNSEKSQGPGIRKWLWEGRPDLDWVVRAVFSEEVSLELRSKQERTNIVKF